MDTIQGPQYPTLNQQQPFNALSTYGQLLDMKNAQQAYANSQVQNQILQSQASTAQSQATQQSQQTKEMQALAGTDWTQYTNPDGSLNQAGAKLANQLAPTTGSEFIQHHAVAGAAQIEIANARQDLSQKQLDRVTQTFAGVANDPNSKASDVVAAGQRLIDNADDADKPAMKKLIDGATKMATLGVPQDDKGQYAMNGPQGLRARIQMMQRGSMPTGGTPQGASNAYGQNVNRDPITGALTMPGGNAPNPTNVGVNAQQQNVTAAQAQDIQTLQSRQQAFQVAQIQQQDAAAYKELTKKGSGAQYAAANPKMAAIARSFGADPQYTTNAQLAEKVYERMAGRAAAGAPDEKSAAAARATIPSPDKNPEAISEAMDQVNNAAQYDIDRFRNLQQRHIMTGNPNGATQSDLQFQQQRGAPSMMPKASAPAAGGVKEGATGTSKSGKAIVYRNGRWEYAQ